MSQKNKSAIRSNLSTFYVDDGHNQSIAAKYLSSNHLSIDQFETYGERHTDRNLAELLIHMCNQFSKRQYKRINKTKTNIQSHQ